MSVEYNTPYSVVTLPLVAAADRVEAIPFRVGVWSVSVRQVTGGLTDVVLHVGKRGNGIPIRQGNEIVFRNVPTSAGLFISSAGGAGGGVVLCVTHRANDGDEAGPAFSVSET